MCEASPFNMLDTVEYFPLEKGDLEGVHQQWDSTERVVRPQQNIGSGHNSRGIRQDVWSGRPRFRSRSRSRSRSPNQNSIAEALKQVHRLHNITDALSDDSSENDPPNLPGSGSDNQLQVRWKVAGQGPLPIFSNLSLLGLSLKNKAWRGRGKSRSTPPNCCPTNSRLSGNFETERIGCHPLFVGTYGFESNLCAFR